jgi:hypothetical protein
MDREAPSTVVRALRAQVSPELGVVWDEVDCVWRFTYEGRTLALVLTHDDGTPMLSLDGYTDAVVRLAQRSDAYQDFGERRKRLRRSVAELRDTARAQRRGRLEDLRPEARDRARLSRCGPRPFITGI